MNHFKIEQIFIDQQVIEDEITTRVRKAFPKINPSIVKSSERFAAYLSNLKITEGKRTLWLTHFKGNFVKPCPGTADSYRCCNYLVVNETTNCPIDCTYCILQGYINNPAITIYTNYRKILDEIQQLSKSNLNRVLRVGTGELTDSLALDPLTRLSEKLIAKVQQLPNVILELKSKTDNIGHLLNLNPQKVVLSWSLNPEEYVQSDEHKSDNLFKRLTAAKQAGEKGFMLGFHFDPILYFPNWKKAYIQLISQLSEQVNPDRIAWISMGSLRYPPHLKEIIRKRFPHSKIFSGDQIKGLDGKTRYIRPLRKMMYRFILQNIREKLGDVFVYFCMEDERMWEDVIGKKPMNNNEIDWYFANNLYQKFPELNLPNPLPGFYADSAILP